MGQFREEARLTAQQDDVSKVIVLLEH